MIPEIEPFENLPSKPIYVINHKLDVIYYDNGNYHIETTIHSIEDNLLMVYRWKFIKELPLILKQHIPKWILKKCISRICVVPNLNILMPTMGGIPKYTTEYENQKGIWEVENPKIFKE